MDVVTFTLNAQRVSFRGDATMPLLWYLRDHAGLVGTKYGCGIGRCGACTVHLDGSAARACTLPLAGIAGKDVRTIEGLAADGALHAVQQAWIDEDVAQCGYCQAGQIMAAAALLAQSPRPSDAQILAIGNLCRCATYPRIRRAIRNAARRLATAAAR
jgi:isoquinoline 1-oxidoreductase alpha subunit